MQHFCSGPHECQNIVNRHRVERLLTPAECMRLEQETLPAIQMAVVDMLPSDQTKYGVEAPDDVVAPIFRERYGLRRVVSRILQVRVVLHHVTSVFRNVSPI